MARRGRGEGSIYYEAERKRWRAVVQLGRKKGKRQVKTFTGRTRREVQQKLIEALRSLHLGYRIEPEKQTLGQWLLEWLEMTRSRVRPRTSQFYETVVRNWILPEAGQVPLARFGASDVQRLLDGALERGLSPTTVRHIHRVLGIALGKAEKLGHVPRNVAKLVDPVKQRKPELKALSPEEAQRFLTAAQEDRFYPIFALLVSLGLRVGEALGLRWSDVDLVAGTISISRTLQWEKTSSGRRPVLMEPKSARARRTLPAPALVREALLFWREQQETYSQCSDWTGNPLGLVFTSRKGTPLDDSNVRRSFRRILESAGLPHLRLHDLRHSCASILIAQGVPARVITEILGHSQVSFTLQTYGHVFDEAKQEAARAMDAALAPMSTPLSTLGAKRRVQ